MRRALLISFQFPPMRGSSAIQRTLRFAQYLPKFGWEPVVLTVSPGAYETRGSPQEYDLGAIEVHRTTGLDAARQLSIRSWYPRSLALPDRWMTWKFSAVRAALRLLKERKFDVVWSTFPIATAHQIGLEVASRSSIPWIAEFRDPMWQGDYPPDPRVNQAWKVLESRIFEHARRVIVTTPGTARDYRARYPTFPPSHISVIENGFDEEAFIRAESSQRPRAPMDDPTARKLTLLHSGVIYESERDPTQFFDAIAMLKSLGDPAAPRLRIVLRATGNDAVFHRMIEDRGIGNIVSLEPALGYVPALAEMLSVDGLLVLQAANCNAQIPAKLYEYFRAGRPILALTDPDGDTAKTVRQSGASIISPLDSVGHIADALREFVKRTDARDWPECDRVGMRRHSREQRTAQLAELLDGAVQ